MNAHEAAAAPSSLAPAASRRWARLQFWVTFAVAAAVLACLLWPRGHGSPGPAVSASAEQSPVRLNGAGHIEIAAGSPLHDKLQVADLRATALTAPVLTVTGTVIASLQQGRGSGRDWQFNSPELLTTYTDWQRAAADIAFTKNQLESIKQLADNRLAAQEVLVQRLQKLVEAGTDTEKDLAAARTELLQARIQGRKELHEAETAWRLAQRTEAGLSRQLQQAGVEPELLRATGKALDIVVADVPEAMLSRVKIGQGCQARFMGLAGKSFTGTVRSLSPVLSKERRSLRVLFIIRDPEDVLRPGMFADIGLGTDSRDALLAPMAGVVHVGSSDYMLVRAEGGAWRIVAVQVGELHADLVEILDGLKVGEQVVGQGAILLKPLIVEATQRPAAQGS